MILAGGKQYPEKTLSNLRNRNVIKKLIIKWVQQQQQQQQQQDRQRKYKIILRRFGVTIFAVEKR